LLALKPLRLSGFLLLTDPHGSGQSAGIVILLEELDYGGNSHDRSAASIGKHDRAAKQTAAGCLGEAVESAYREAIEQLDRQSTQAVLEDSGKLKAEVSAAVFEIIHSHTVSHKFEDEEVPSNRAYPPTYRLRRWKRR